MDDGCWGGGRDASGTLDSAMAAMPRSIVLSLIALSLGCVGDPTTLVPFPGYAEVTAGPDCPPAGRMATSLVFRPAPAAFDALGPQLRLAIWRDRSALWGKTFASSDRPSTGGGYECAGSESCPPLTNWRVQFDRRQPDEALVGVLTVFGADGVARRGRFRAVWQPRVVYCI